MVPVLNALWIAEDSFLVVLTNRVPMIAAMIPNAEMNIGRRMRLSASRDSPKVVAANAAAATPSAMDAMMDPT